LVATRDSFTRFLHEYLIVRPQLSIPVYSAAMAGRVLL
jgi:hypothetical protein